MTLSELFETVDRIGVDECGCKVWTLPSMGNRYAIREVNGSLKKIARLVLVRKLGRDIASGLLALHTCDNKMCVSEDHIYEGTHTQNMIDASLRKRFCTGDRHIATHPPPQTGAMHYSKRTPHRVVRGSKQGNAVLNEEQVREMRRLHEEDSIREIDLKRRYAVSQGTVNSILNYRSWRHV